MTVQELVKRTNFEPILLSDPMREVKGGYAGDLLSWVMGRAKEGDCWVTIMSNVNVAAVAQLADVACVVFAEGVRPDETLLNAAKTHRVNLLLTREDVFSTCCKVAEVLQ